SRLFASLPRTEVPQEFPTKVLQLAERRMLLPEAGVNSTKRRRLWILGAGASLTASAAVLLICLQLQSGDPAPGNPGGRHLPLPGVVNRARPNSSNEVPQGATDPDGRFVTVNTPGQPDARNSVDSGSQVSAVQAKGAVAQSQGD